MDINKISRKYYNCLKPDEKGTNNALLSHETLGVNSLIVWHRLPENVKRNNRYFHFRNFLEYFKFQQDFVDYHYFNEVILGETIQKPYFDIDGEGLSTKDGEVLRDQIIEGILKVNDNIKLTDILVFNSHRPNKVSYHIIVDRWAFTNNKSIKGFQAEVLHHVDDNFHEYVDQLGKSTQNLRIFNSMKYPYNIKKVLDPKSPWKYDDDDANDAIILGASLVTNTSYCKLLPNYDPPEEKVTGGSNISGDEANLVFDITKKYFESKNLDFPFSISKAKGPFIWLKRESPSFCIKCNRVHDNQPPLILVMGESKCIYFDCRRGKEKLYISRLVVGPIDRKPDYVPKNFIKEWTPGPNVEIVEYEERYVRKLDTNHKFQVVKSPMGTGKTEAITEFLRDDKNLSFVILSARRSYAQSMTGKYTEKGFEVECYLDSDTPGKNLVISAESLHNLKRVYDVVIIDEVSSFLAEMDSGFHRNNLHLNREKLELLVKHAKYVFCMDADIDESTFRFLDYISPNEKIIYYKNTYKSNTNLEIKEVTDAPSIFSLLKWYLDNGKNIQIVLGSQKFGEYYLEPILQNAGLKPAPGGYIFHHSNGDDYPDVLKNVEQEWVKYRVVMYTSTIGPGIDFSTEHFHLRFSFPYSTSNTVDQFDQMRMRVRKLIDNTEFILYQTRRDNMLTDHTAVRQTYENKFNDSNKRTKELLDKYSKELKAYECKGNLLWKLDDTFWNWNTIHNECKVGVSRNWYYGIHKKKIESSGASLIKLDWSIDEKSNKALKEWMKEQRKGKKAEEIEELDAIDISGVDIKEIEKKIEYGNATHVEKVTANKAHVCNNFEGTVEGAEVVEYNKHPQKFKNAYMEEHLTELAILNIDSHNREYKSVPQPLIVRYELIKILCQAIGVRSTMDRTSVVDSRNIRARVDWFKQTHPYFKTHFDLRSGEVKDYRGVVDLINGVFEKWSSVSLMKVERKKFDGKDEFLYKLVASEHFDSLYLKYKKWRIDDNIWKPKLIPEDTESQIRSLDKASEDIDKLMYQEEGSARSI